MRIAFVTNCLEPGRDGVGDYTRLLAAECARRGHHSFHIALNDPFLAEIEQSEGWLRFPSRMAWGERATLTKHTLLEFSPDWVSFQFVCYGYDRRGFAGRVGQTLIEALSGWPIQIFFHELWLGEEVGSTLKHRVIGWLQKNQILSLTRALAPRVVQTSNAAYAHLLAQNQIAASVLPLFGALPLPTRRGRAAREKLVFAMFGVLHPVWPAEPLFSQLRKLNYAIEIAHAGRIGSGAALWEELEARFAGDFTFRRLGELPAQQMADFLADADFGIATTPWEIIGKSATVAAMLDSGLPVVVNRDDVHFSGFTPSGDHSPMLLQMSGDLASQLASVSRTSPQLRLPEAADRFLIALQGGAPA